MEVKIGLLQYSVYRGERQNNEEIIETYMEEAKRERPQVIVLPEMWTTGYDLENLQKNKNVEETNGTAALAKLIKWAKETGAYIVGGSTAVSRSCYEPPQFANTMYVVNQEGEKILTYEKAHLFRLMDEDKYMVAGQQCGNFMLDRIPCGAIICYDLRFPEWVRKTMLANKAQVLFVVAQWPKSRLKHWITLLQARAIENQCFVIACNRNGSDNERSMFAGHSMVIDPWGDLIGDKKEETGWLWAEIEVAKVEKVRKRIPVFTDRRTDLY
ncbi:carbon-nitrogen family hydrolase [Heliorestis convoluta]|uniref:Carbon-nitrogen family hydrolase n=1 Tax=Heliorestis convoluta TaxID=356322 RepID=A0A5Q2N6L7_9FIRM|nr:carbon-nitrogen family hydrolase [Heliorestis convoluta]QGG49276.1 carbon-nitrogen family hydrolase [Heliorestis convoluta]